MGIVFSCLASACMLIGELASTLFLAVGEVGSLLARGLFGLIVGICDVLAACMCCCQVPFSERPDRNGYTYTTLATKKTNLVNKTKFSNASFAAIPKSVSNAKTVSDDESDVNDKPAEKVVAPAAEEKKLSEETTPAAVEATQDKSALKTKAAEEKTAKKVAASEAKKAKKAELAAAKLAKKEAKKSGGKGAEATEEAASTPVVVEEPAVSAPEPVAPTGWFGAWFSAAPAPAPAPAPAQEVTKA